MMGHVAKVEAATRVSALTQMVREAFEEREGDVEKTVNYMVTQLSNDKKLLRATIEAEVRMLVSDRVHRQIRQQNAAIVSAAGRDSVVVLAGGLVRSFLDWRFSDGSKLRDADRAKVAEKAQEYQERADTNGHRASWLRLVAQHLPDGKIVGDVMTEDRLLELFNEAKHA